MGVLCGQGCGGSLCRQGGWGEVCWGLSADRGVRVGWCLCAESVVGRGQVYVQRGGGGGGLAGGGGSHLRLAGAAIGDVGSDGVAEEAGVLGHHPYLAAVPLGIHLCQRHPINQHLNIRVS